MSTSATLQPEDGIEGTARAPDGLMLRTIRWQPQAPPWSVLVLVHGLGEHAGRYRHVGRALAEAGIDVHAFDLRGFGASAGPRAWIDRWSRFHDDLESRLEAARLANPALPLILYGHSMGGLVTLGYVLADPVRGTRPDLLALSGPGIDSTTARWKVVLAPLIAALVPRMRIANGIGPGALSRDPRVDQANAADPLVQSSTTAHFGAEAFREQRRLRELLRHPGPLPMPTYVFHGGDDPVVPTASSEVFEGRPNVTRRVHPGLRHETHNEPEGPEVIADLVTWLRAAVAAGVDSPDNSRVASGER